MSKLQRLSSFLCVKGLQWERALDLFDEMKMKRLPITVVSYGAFFVVAVRAQEVPSFSPGLFHHCQVLQFLLVRKACSIVNVLSTSMK